MLTLRSFFFSFCTLKALSCLKENAARYAPEGDENELLLLLRIGGAEATEHQISRWR